MAFCSCCLLDAARAQQPATARRPVTVGGKRVKTVDAHSHCYFQAALDLMGAEAATVIPQTNPAITLKKKPTEYLNQLHFDALVFTPEGWRHLAAQVGASQIALEPTSQFRGSCIRWI
jgi:hypothetical protein